MHFQLPALSLLLLAIGTFAAPAPAPAPISVEKIAEIKTIKPLISLRERSPLERRQGQCNWDGYCLGAWQSCVKTCASFSNGDCFDVQTSPECEGCGACSPACPAGAGGC